MDEHWCCEKLENLKIQENRLTTLAEIRGRLNATTSSHLEERITNRLLTAPEIYECVENENGREHCELVTDILSICMASLSINQGNLPTLLQRAIEHPRACVRALAFNTILREVVREKNNERALNKLISDELVMHLFNGLQDPETEVGAPALEILSIVLENRLEQAAVRERMQKLLSSNDVIKCRVYELATNLAKRSPATLKKVETLLDRALSELDNDDVLLQVNILEILVSLAEQNHGLLYLEKRQVFEVISTRVEGLEQNPIDRLLVPGIMKFFGKVASVQPQKIIEGYPHMVQCLFESIRSSDTLLLPPAFDTLANLAHSQNGKLLLEKHYAAAMRETFEDIAAHLKNLPSDLKNRAFSTLEMIFSREDTVSSEISELLHRWFIHLAAGPNMQFLMEFCRNPFPDIKVSCLSFIRTLCLYPWGIIALKNTAGFVEYLLDRKFEFDKEAKYAKYEVIQLLADSDVFDVQTNIQLRTYVNEGPYYVQTMMEVAVEGN